MPTPSENVHTIKPFKLTAYNIFHQIVTRIITAIEIFDQGFWLGMLNDDDLDILTDAYYKTAQTYRDKEYNESGFFDWEKQIVKNYFNNYKELRREIKELKEYHKQRPEEGNVMDCDTSPG